MSPHPSSRVALSVRRSVMVAALIPLLSLAVAGCSGDDGKLTVTGSSGAASTTVATGDEATSPDDGSAGETTTTEADGSTDPTETSEPAGDAGAGPSTATADEDALDPSWTAGTGEYRGQDGLRVAYNCPAGGTITSVWGTGPFTDDSSVCTAGVFAGLITPEDGGRIVIEVSPGLESYATAEAHGVTTQSYGTWAGSFTLVSSDG